MNLDKTVAGGLMLTLSAAAIGIAPHAQCNGQEEVIGCRHDGHIDRPEPEGPIRQAHQLSAGSGSTAVRPFGNFMDVMPKQPWGLAVFAGVMSTQSSPLALLSSTM